MMMMMIPRGPIFATQTGHVLVTSAKISNRLARASSGYLDFFFLCVTDPPPDIARPPSAPPHPAQKIEMTDETDRQQCPPRLIHSASRFTRGSASSLGLLATKGSFGAPFCLPFFASVFRRTFETSSRQPPQSPCKRGSAARNAENGKRGEMELVDTHTEDISERERRQHREGQIQPSPRIDGIGIGIGKIHGSSTIINRQTR